MTGIVVNIDPVIFQIGHFAIRWYSLFIISAVIVAVLISVREVKRRGLSPDIIYSLVPWVLIGGVAGARLFHVIDRWPYYAQNPAAIFQFQQGGLAIWGALAGGAVAALLFARLKNVPVPGLLDALVPGLLSAQIIGRLGCIINGDAYGTATSLPWGFIYANPDAVIPTQLAGVPTHPYPVYDMLWNGVVLLLALTVGRRFKNDGMVFLGYLVLYAAGRFVFTFVRQENVWFWGLQEAQVVALFILAATAAAFGFNIMRSRQWSDRAPDHAASK